MMITSESGRRLDDEDVKLAEEVASRAALAAYHLLAYEKASRDLERLYVEMQVRETYLSQVRHDILNILTGAALSAEVIIQRNADRTGALAQRIKGAILRASDILRKTR
jgi:GAF domain-containing protein